MFVQEQSSLVPVQLESIKGSHFGVDVTLELSIVKIHGKEQTNY
jgi:hypothetical protein